MNEHYPVVPQKGFDIVVVGGINSDFVLRGKDVPKPGETVVMSEFFQGPGGKGANQAVAAARLGARVAMIGCVGDDDRGEVAIRNLKREGVETRFIARAKTFTGAALILVDHTGEKSIGACMGANAKLTAAHVQAAAETIRCCNVLLMQLEVSDAPLLAAVKLKNDHRIFLDPAPPRKISPQLLKRIEVIRPNSSEAEFLTGIKVTDRQSARRAAKALIKRGVPTVIVQAGDGGDLLVTENDETYSPHFKVNSVDATGAGDAFAAAFATDMTRLKSTDSEILRFASAAAALKTTKMGAQAGLPTRRAVEQFLRKHH